MIGIPPCGTVGIAHPQPERDRPKKPKKSGKPAKVKKDKPNG